MPFSATDNPDVSIRFIGKHYRPVVVLDNAHPHPQSLREFALAQDFAADPQNFYPGVRAPAPAEYSSFLAAQLERFMAVFDPRTSGARIATSLYSLPVTPTEKLRPIQCVPHIDTHSAGHIAAVHYLCEHSGTSFYRHRETETEYVTEENLPSYFARVKQQMLDRREDPPVYINGSNALFERIEQIPARFNRLIFYPANNLHAGDLSPEHLSENPHNGRLTINSFCVLELSR